MQPSLSLESKAPAPPRIRANRANALYSTGPRTAPGKVRSSKNALTHGLTSRVPVMPGEDRDAYQQHCQQFRAEYRPQTPTEAELVQDLADTAWRLRRVARLEAELPSREPRVINCHHALATLSAHGQRLSRQFHKTFTLLRDIQAERRECESRDAQSQHSGKLPPRNPAPPPPENGFVFSAADVEALGLHQTLLNRCLEPPTPATFPGASSNRSTHPTPAHTQARA